MAIGKFEQATSVFAGQGDMVIFDAVEDYNTAAFANLANPKSLGQIVQESTSWEGEDPETTSILDEQGNTITATTAAGTLGFSYDMASTSLDRFKVFLKGVDIESLENAAIGTGIKAVGFGVNLPVITRPIMILNDELTKAFLYPKAKIVSNLTLSDGLWRIHSTVTCEYLDTPTLKTGMVLEATFNYEAA